MYGLVLRQFLVLAGAGTAFAGKVDLGRKASNELAGLSSTYVTADQVSAAVGAAGTSPADFARVMEILRRANTTLPAGGKPLNWTDVQTDWNSKRVARGKPYKKLVDRSQLGERDKLLYDLYQRKAQGFEQVSDTVRANFAYGYARYLFDDLWGAGSYLNPDRSEGSDYAFFRTPYAYVAWGLFQTDRGLTEKKSVNASKSPFEQKADLWGRVCPDLRGARSALLHAIELDRAQSVEGFAAFGSRALASFRDAVKTPLDAELQAVAGAKTYGAFCMVDDGAVSEPSSSTLSAKPGPH